MLSQPFLNHWRVVVGCSGVLLVILLSVIFSACGPGSAELTIDAPPLDSFSRPALAVAVLNRESQRLLASYVEARDETRSSPRAEVESGQAQGLSPLLPTSAEVQRPLSDLAKLHAQVSQLKFELDCRMMWLYSETGQCLEFLNCYFQIVEEAPDSPDILQWLPQALKCAQSCNRTADLTAVLRHFVQFRASPLRARNVCDLLEQRGVKLFPRDLTPRP